MNIHFDISQSERGKFVTMCEAVIRNVDRGTKSATELACAEILADSLAQVPMDTGTLASTGNYVVRRRSALKGYHYEGIVGYAGAIVSGNLGQGVRGSVGSVITSVNAQMGYNPINPKNGLPASAYAAIVHEDLNMPHPNGGKAKFLEDPVRAYASKFTRVAETYWRWAIETTTGRGYNRYGRLTAMPVNVYRRVKLLPGQVNSSSTNRNTIV